MTSLSQNNKNRNWIRIGLIGIGGALLVFIIAVLSWGYVETKSLTTVKTRDVKFDVDFSRSFEKDVVLVFNGDDSCLFAASLAGVKSDKYWCKITEGRIVLYTGISSIPTTKIVLTEKDSVPELASLTTFFIPQASNELKTWVKQGVYEEGAIFSVGKLKTVDIMADGKLEVVLNVEDISDILE